MNEETFECVECGKVKPKREMSPIFLLVCKRCAK